PRARLEPLEAQHDREPAGTRLGLEDRPLYPHRFPAAAIQGWIDQRGVERRIAGRLARAASAEESRSSAKPEDRRDPPAQAGQPADRRGTARQRDRQLRILAETEKRSAGERRARRQERPPHPHPRPTPPMWENSHIPTASR